ncbi:hypothetical protein BD626DRAFT_352112, partial [Schizophyllum amplum]
MPWSSTHSGWRSRATPHFNPPDLTSATLKFAVKVNAPAFTYPLLAVFSAPGISAAPEEEEAFAVDAQGAVLKLAPEDYKALTALARGVDAMQDTGVGEAWRVKSPITCRPIHVLLVPQPEQPTAAVVAAEGGRKEPGALRETSVYAFSKENAQLSKPVGELTELPDAMREFFGLVEEAEGEGDADELTLTKMKALLNIGER